MIVAAGFGDDFLSMQVSDESLISSFLRGKLSNDTRAVYCINVHFHRHYNV